MHNIKKVAWLLPLLLPLAQVAWSADDLVTSQLVDEARTWQQKDRDDLAADVLRKLLRINPGHPEAMVSLAGIEARAGNLREAEALYGRAARLSPVPRGLAGVQALIAEKKGVPLASKEVGSPKPGLVRPKPEPQAQAPVQPQVKARVQPEKKPEPQASKPAAASTTTTTSAASTTVKDNSRDVKSITVKGVSTSEKPAKTEKEAAKQASKETALGEDGSSGNDWAETRQRLEERARRSPGDAKAIYALAKHLTQRDATRREALRQLSYLSQQKFSSRDLKQVWRQALLAIEGHAGDQPLFNAYMRVYPDDATIGARLRGLPADASHASSASADVAAPPAMAQQVVAAPEATFEGGNKVKAASLMRQALDDEQRGTYSNAASKLENALLLDPATPAIRISLARQYERLGAYDNAGNLLDDMLSVSPGMTEALHARARVYAAQHHFDEALKTLERIPAGARTADMARDQRRIWISVQTARARYFYRTGDIRQAHALMERVEAEFRGNDAMMVNVAAAWNDAGQPARGLRLMRDILSHSPTQSASTRIKYAELLLNNFQDTELSAVLRELSAPGKLNRQQQEEVNRIILSYSIRLAETLRESGQFSQATAILAPLMQRSDDVRILVTMARIHRSAAEPVQALSLIEQAIVRNPRDLEQRLIAVDVALAGRENDKAQVHARAALDLASRHPRALAAAGRVEKALRNVDKAIDFFKRAHAAEQNAESFTGVPTHLQVRLVNSAYDMPAPARAPGQGDATQGLLPIPEVGPSGGRPSPGLMIIPDAGPAQPAGQTPRETSAFSPAPAPAPGPQIKQAPRSRAPTSVLAPEKPLAKEEAAVRTRTDIPRPASPFASPNTPRPQASLYDRKMAFGAPSGVQPTAYDYPSQGARAETAQPARAVHQSASQPAAQDDSSLRLRMTTSLRLFGGKKWGSS
jgi:tetratricopeptide (TPR) repeat protein